MPAPGGASASGAGSVVRSPEVRALLYWACFLAIVLGAVLARFWALETQPGGLFQDEAAEGLSAQRLLNEPGYHPVFFSDDGGREALYAYIVAAGFRLFGASVTTLRGTSALLGVLGVLAIWAATRRFGRGATVGAAAWAAGSLWLICVSRDGMRNVITIVVGALALAALLSWGDRPGRVRAALAGAAVGAGLWTYQPLKLLPVLAIGWLFWMRHTDRDRYVFMRRTLPWAVAAYLAVAAPMIWTAITDFNNYFGRGAGVSVFNPGVNSPDSYPVHILRTLGMVLFTGDPNQRQDVDSLPLLGPLLFIPFAVGLWRAWRRRTEHGHALLLLGLLVFLIPPLVATEAQAPHFLRALGLAPFVAGLVGIGLVEIVEGAARASRRVVGRVQSLAPAAVALACGAALVGVGAASVHAYLDRPLSERYDAFSYALVQLAAAGAGGPGTIVIVNDYNAFDVRFLDAADLPTIVAPGERVSNPAVYSLIVASSREDIAASTDAATASRASVAATDPQGRAVVFEVVP